MMQGAYADNTVECHLHARLDDEPRVIHMTSSPPATIRIHHDGIDLASVYVLVAWTHGVAEYLFDHLA